MKSYTNNQLKRKLQNKGIILDDNKRKQFDKYSYYQVVNAYKNIFATTIENIDDIKNNIENEIDIDRYCNNFNIDKTDDRDLFFRNLLYKICQKYSINYKTSDTTDELVNKIKKIKYYNHIYSSKVCYSDFIRMYKFEHELRNVMLRYTLIIEESLKNILVTYLNSIEAKDTFLTDINQYETGQGNINHAIESIKKIFDKQTNKHSNPIKRKNDQNISVPYWILINELTLGETIKLITNLNYEHNRNILECCVNYFTKMEIIYRDDFEELEEKEYWNHLNAMREMLNIIGIFRNNLAHNQPIYNFNVKEFSSSKSGSVNYLLPKAKNKNEQYVLNTTYMSYFADFFGSDKYNSFAGNSNIDLSWIIYVIYKFITHLDTNTNFYTELTYVYKKFNIILRPTKVAINKYNLYEDLLADIEKYSELDFEIDNIINRYDNNERIKMNLTSLNKKINDMKKELKKYTVDNQKNNECLKYTHFLFDGNYTKYTGIDKKYFDKLM